MSQDKETEEDVYTSQGFEAFLQQAELSGIPRHRQDELLALFLAQDITLDIVILHSIRELWQSLRKRKFRVLCVLLVAAVVGFVLWSDAMAAQGHMEYQPWQWEMAALWKMFHINVLGFIDWEPFFRLECVLPNPYYYLTRPDKPPVDCVNNPRNLSVVEADKYSGYLNTDFPLPLLLTDAQKEWRFNENSSLHDLHQLLSASSLSHYPCIDYVGGDAVPPQFIADPLAALVDGTLTFEDGRRVESLFLRGCSSHSNRNLRKISKRPKFLDAHIESLQSMTVIVTKGISSGTILSYHLKPRNPEAYRKQLWVAQVLGSSRVAFYDLDCPGNEAIYRTFQPGHIIAVGPEDALSLEIQGNQETLVVYNEFETFEER